MTLRRAIRRFLRILVALAAVSVVTFWGVARLATQRSGPRANPFAALPMFINVHPQGVADRALLAMNSVAAQDRVAERSRQTLLRLGGAALPYVLPKLDALHPEGRARVAQALIPLAMRMGVAAPEDVAGPEQAILFWNRFWQDRAIDFRPPVVKRLVARVAERSLALRRDDVVHLDTYALEELVVALGRVDNQDDVRRVQRLSSVLSQITGERVPIDQNAGVAEARTAVESWQHFWLVHGSEYTPLDGARRIAAMVTETQYGKWFMLVLRARFGKTLDGESVFALIGDRLVPTAALLGAVLAVALALLGTVHGASRRPNLRSLGRALPRLTAELPLLLSLVVLLELVLRVEGACAAAVTALRRGDINAWMGLSLSIALVTLMLTSILDGALAPVWAEPEAGRRK